MKLLLYIWLLFSAGTAWAQADEKCFKAYDQQGDAVKVLCVGQEYAFQDCDNVVPDANEYYVFDYRKGTPITNASDDQRHTFTTPGTYRVLQVANYGSNTLTDTVSVVFEVKESPAPAFTTQRCAGGAVTVILTDDNYSSYTIRFGDARQVTGAAPGSVVQHRYANAGSYTLTVSGSYTGGTCTGESTAEIITLPTAPAPFVHNLTVLQQAVSGQIQVELENLQPGFDYLVQRWDIGSASPSFLTIDTLRTITQATFSHLLPIVNSQEGTSYRVLPYDACGSKFMPSNAVSSIALEVTSEEEEAILKWQSVPHAQRFEIYRNGALLQTLGASTNQFTDTAVNCGQTYIYALRGIASDGSISASAPKEVQVVSTAAPAAPYLFASYTLNNEVELSLELPQNEMAQQISYERSTSGSAYQALAQGQQAIHTDAVPAAASHCYRAGFTNACGNTSSLSNVACPIFLEVRMQGDGAAVVLEWTKYEGFPNGVRQYTVELLDESDLVVKSYTATGTTYTDRALSDDQPQLRYRIKGTASNGSSTYSNVAVIDQEITLHIPSGFTPNGDGLNDILEVKGRFFNSYSIRIYNNLGHVIYEGTAADAGWDGTYKGELQPAGAYAYEITAAADSGAKRRRTGTVTLLR
ncbi:hypothetical protein GCM10023188_12360 [Pontibacter saemangeumensis]|uniref:PKD domain-containing protein n=1 Tax=Pontibacter saemangeumensis TaxID=1084525 RepID=A0ABP8LG53_9BACT